jgi:hypothetical protein
MKVMNILVISLVVVVGSLFLFNEKAAAQSAVAIGDIAIMHSYNEATSNLEIIVYHKPSNSFLLYGYSSKASKVGKGLQLLHIRRLENDFAFAEKTKKKLEYRKDGYDVDRIKSMIGVREAKEKIHN